MISTADIWQYAGVFGALIVSAFGAPIPEELPIATGGVLVGKEWQNPDTGMKWWIMLPLCIVGVVMCDTILYGIGRKWGLMLAQKQWVQKRFLPPAKLEKIKKNFEDYGIGILLIARLLPGIRTPVFITAGMVRLPFYRFLLADGIYAIPGVNLLFWLAYWFTDSFMDVLHRLENYRPLIMVAIISFIAGWITKSFANRRVTTGDPNELPVIGKPLVNVGHHHHHHHKPEESPPPPKEDIPTTSEN